MGKRIIYTNKPKSPRAAKVAWTHIEDECGAPRELWFDSTKGEWVALYESKEIRIPAEDIS